ncbi:MAG: hypothetical protein ABSB22_16250, partial [Thermodesulfobacteriota bacterium]
MKFSTRKYVLVTKLVTSLVLLMAPIASPSALNGVSPAAASERDVTVMTRNLYVGAAFDLLISAPTPNDIPERVALIYAAILSSEFPCRAEVIADEIVQNQLRVQSPCRTPPPNPPQPTAFAIDYVQILLDALERRGAHYAVATFVTNTDVTALSETGDTIRLTDRDVILVRTDLSNSDLRVLNSQAQNFKTRFTVQAGGPSGPTLTVLRGWCSVDVR